MVNNNEFQIFIDAAFSKEDGNTSFGYAIFFKGQLLDAGAFKGLRMLNSKEVETGAVLCAKEGQKSWSLEGSWSLKCLQSH